MLPGPRLPMSTVRMALRPFDEIERLHAKYGDVIAFGYPPTRFVLVCGPRANEWLLSGEVDAFTWGEAMRTLAVVDGETALVVTDGEDHKRRRRIVQPAFATRRIESYRSIMDEEFTAAVGGWRAGAEVDAYSTLRAALRRVTIRALFGDDFGASADLIGEVLDPALEFVDRPIASQIRMGPLYQRAKRARARADDVVRAAIARRDADADRPDVLAWLLGSELGEQEVLDQVVSLIAAGYGTTSAAIGWAVLRVLERPAVLERLRAGDEDYLDGVVSEVLRLHPPGAVAPRKVMRDVTFDGHRIRRGTTILYSALVTHRMPEHWEDPLAFRPERWLDGFEPAPYTFVPFGGGYRRCIGFAMATMEIRAAVAALVARPGVSLVPEQRIEPKGIGAMHPWPGVRVRIGG